MKATPLCASFTQIFWYPVCMPQGLQAAMPKKIPGELSNSSTGTYSPPAMADFTKLPFFK